MRTRVIAEASTLYYPALVRIVDGEGLDARGVGECLDRSHGRIVRALRGSVGRSSVALSPTKPRGSADLGVARSPGRELNLEDDWGPEWE